MNNTDNLSLKNKIAIVTGGTRGIGLAIAERLLREGAKVAICGTRQESVDGALGKLAPLGDAFGAVADVSVFEQVKQFVAKVERKFGGVDILINNAGVGTFRPMGEMSPEEWDRIVGVNLSGIFYSSHEVLPILKQRQGGDIINIGSLAGKNPLPGGAGYNASKFGLVGLSEATMLDHRRDGVRVSCIMPGSVATEFGGHGAGAGAEWKIAPEDIAEVVVSLLSMPRRTTVSRVEIRPSMPPEKS